MPRSTRHARTRPVRRARSLVWSAVLFAVVATLTTTGIAVGASGDPLMIGQANSSSCDGEVCFAGDDHVTGLGATVEGAPTLRVENTFNALGEGEAPGTAIVAAAAGRSTGLYAESAAGTGVHGNSADGDGVIGTSQQPAQSGVYGYNDEAGGYGVFGRANNGSAIAGSSTNGYGLDITGRVGFSRSGRLVIPAGSATVSEFGIRLEANTLIIATLQQRRRGVFIEAVVPRVNDDFFVIYLNRPVDANTRVAWFALN